MNSGEQSCCYNTAAEEHPGILSRWSWRRVLQLSGGIGLEPRQRCVFCPREHRKFTANEPPGPRDAAPLGSGGFSARVLSKTRSRTTFRTGPDLEMGSWLASAGAPSSSWSNVNFNDCGGFYFYLVSSRFTFRTSVSLLKFSHRQFDE